MNIHRIFLSPGTNRLKPPRIKSGSGFSGTSRYSKASFAKVWKDVLSLMWLDSFNNCLCYYGFWGPISKDLLPHPGASPHTGVPKSCSQVIKPKFHVRIASIRHSLIHHTSQKSLLVSTPSFDRFCLCCPFSEVSYSPAGESILLFADVIISKGCPSKHIPRASG